MPQSRSPGILYRLLSLGLFPVWLLHALRHGSKHALPTYLRMRLFFSGGRADGDQVWVHASSVGEVKAISPLVHALLSRGERVLFTTFTATGFKAVRQGFADSVNSGIIPIDFSWQCNRFLSQHQIRLGLIMETELWPELLYQARRRQIPLLLVNARLSRKTLNANRFVLKLLGFTLGCFDRILARNQKDQEAFCSLGVDPDRIEIIGNLKTRTDDLGEYSRLIEREYLILASSHSGEEQQFLEACPDELKSWLLVLAPRHPDRSAALQTLLDRSGLKYAVRSKAQAITPDTQVYLADTLGELKSLLAFARVVVMGGSFDNTGGHNLIEPASLGCAIITGPSDANISEDIAMLGPDHGLVQVSDMDACWRAISTFIEQPERARAMSREAQARLASQPDVVQNYLSRIEAFL